MKPIVLACAAACLLAAALPFLAPPRLHPPVESLGSRGGWYASDSSAAPAAVVRIRTGNEPGALEAWVRLGDEPGWIPLGGVLYPDEIRLRSAPGPDGAELRIDGRFGPSGTLRARIFRPEEPGRPPREVVLQAVSPRRHGATAWQIPHVAAASCVHPSPAPDAGPLGPTFARCREEALDETWDHFHGLVDMHEEPDPLAIGGYWYEERWTLASATATRLSLLGNVACHSGGAHPNYGFRTRTFWLRDDDVVELRLARLFPPCSPWLDALSERVLARLREAGAGWVVDGAVSRLEEADFAHWTIDDRALEVYFAPYAMGPFSDGAFRVTLPFDELGDLLDAQGPLGEHAR